ncbi:ATP synthase subunit I [Candidatus Xianfuyuplasma coldseepsis]|uniref:ATP synthase subunit I n=1 Tax=Candidatus Xianfuyuplasma coldseepsis TaxID=2782163 RepID=A0A7L7KRH1_9MOLU|nr:ATP synthase subunit I [Xianfuyuplasma coldseepsis]QMS85421.1 hypothetical protein G4Z02_06515 [Xianfuyuplasma coldseepsis]
MNDNSNAFIKAFPITWVVTGVVAVLLYFVVSDMWAYSFVLGSATSLMMMSMMYKTTKKILDEQAKDASKRVVRNYIFRYLFYAIILVAVGLSDTLIIVATAIGLLTFKVSIYIALFLEKRGGTE